MRTAHTVPFNLSPLNNSASLTLEDARVRTRLLSGGNGFESSQDQLGPRQLLELKIPNCATQKLWARLVGCPVVLVYPLVGLDIGRLRVI
jgi:hypothetical protein